MGFVDLHDHLLWGIDDGCGGPEQTLEAARLLVALGWSELRADGGYYYHFPDQTMAGYAPFLSRIANPTDRSEAQAVLSAAKAADGLRIVVAEYAK